jgi:hypothetical protein
MPKHKKASANTRRKGVSTKQIDRIRTLSHEGKSANQIQHTLSREHIGLRRTVLLPYVREFKGKQPQANVQKYTPHKYRGTTAQKAWRRRARHDYRHGRVREKEKEAWGAKRVVLQGLIDGERVQITRNGSGKELYQFVKGEMDSKSWDREPHVTSE